MIINADMENVTVIDIHNPNVRVEVLWPRDQFSSLTGITIPDGIHGWVYEPERSLYIILRTYDDLDRFDSPSEHTFLNLLHARAGAILHEAIAEMLPLHVYNAETGEWYIPEDVQLEQDRLDRQTQRLRTLQQATIDQFQMILQLFKVGRDKGVWVAGDFPPALRTKVQEWQTLIDEFKAEHVDEPEI